jgi:hypothetical protein
VNILNRFHVQAEGFFLSVNAIGKTADLWRMIVENDRNKKKSSLFFVAVLIGRALLMTENTARSLIVIPP